MKQYQIVGPFDRYNYGDLLFPLILEKALQSESGSIVNYYGLIDSDLSQYSGKPTRSIKDLYQQTKSGDHVIIAGGESLCTSWADLYSYLSPKFNKVYKYKLVRAVDRRTMLVSKIAKHLCGGSTDLPFSFSSSELNMNIDISLNCVGGAAIASWTDTKRRFLKKKIQNHKAIGVRDRKTFSILSEKGDLPSLKLVPDSAILMERLLSDEMEQRKHTFSHYKSIQNDYIFFQVGCEKTDDLDEVISNLDSVLSKSSFDLVLCPIGHALGHEDLLPLKTIRSALIGKHGARVILIEPIIDVYEIMMLISKSSMYIGTSLHGTITSLSFGVPYITFNKQIKKLEEYIKTWGAPGLTTQYDAKDISVAFDRVSGITKQSILEHTRPQKDLVTEFISELTS